MRLSLATLAAAAAIVLSSTLVGAGCTHGEGLDTSKLPEDIRADYVIFARKCSKCHSLARPLTSNITDDEQWVMYVNRMRRQPGSGISPDDQTHILRFLRFYAADLRRIQAEKRGGAPAAGASGAAPASSGQNAPVLSPPSTSAPGIDGGGT